MNYTEKITLEQALMLKEKIAKGEINDISAMIVGEKLTSSIDVISEWVSKRVYDNEACLYLTRPDYAQYIQGNNPLPDGYGYPSKDLGSGLYNGIPYMFCFGDQSNIWLSTEQVFNLKTTTITKWYEVAFKLTDLARVEAEAVVSKMERTEINAAQCMWLINQTTVYSIFRNGVMVSLGAGYWMDLRVSDKDVYEILTTTYNSLPDEFKALAEPKPSMLAHFEPDWKAKYIELEEQHNTLIKHLQEATASADSLQDRLTDAQNCIAVQEREITKLKNYIINQLIND